MPYLFGYRGGVPKLTQRNVLHHARRCNSLQINGEEGMDETGLALASRLQYLKASQQASNRNTEAAAN
jgi:hypothetical protein